MYINTMKAIPDTTFKSGEKITIRPLASHEVHLLSTCIYDEYSDLYPNKIVYNVVQFAEALQTNSIYSLIAETENGEIAGHLAIIHNTELLGLWEMGIGVVMRKFRNMRIMDKLSIDILKYSKHSGILGVFAEPVLNHTHTQKLTMEYNMTVCGIILASWKQANASGKQPKASIFLEDTGYSSVGMSLLAFSDESRFLYLADEIRDFVQNKTTSLGLKREIVSICSRPSAKGKYYISQPSNDLNYGKMYAYIIGHDFEEKLCKMHTQCINSQGAMSAIYINLNDSAAPIAYEIAKKYGYFCTGFLPLSSYGDMLIVQNTMQSIVDYDAMITVDQYTEVLEKIKMFQHNRLR